MFVGLAGDRCEALLSSPSSTPLQHLRCLALLLGILVNTVSWMADHVALLGDDRAKLSSAALWLFDGATVVVEASHGIVKYGGSACYIGWVLCANCGGYCVSNMVGLVCREDEHASDEPGAVSTGALLLLCPLPGGCEARRPDA